MPKAYTSTDPRIGKTIRDIKRALSELVVKRPFDEIRAEDIFELAPVSKRTFYKYFGSKYDVLDAIREDILGELSEDLKNSASPDSISGGKAILPFIKYR